jgi:hypothetical protein
MIAHLALYRPKGDVTADQRRSFAQTLQAVVREIATVRRVRVGKVEAASISGNFELGDTTDMFVAVLEFDDTDGLKTYLEHPKHQELARLFWLYTDATAILDAAIVDAKLDDLEKILG